MRGVQRTFNRTSMELKHLCCIYYAFGCGWPFNRTSMELKPWLAWLHETYYRATFNRTSMELKLDFLPRTHSSHNILLIEPVWN